MLGCLLLFGSTAILMPSFLTRFFAAKRSAQTPTSVLEMDRFDGPPAGVPGDLKSSQLVVPDLLNRSMGLAPVLLVVLGMVSLFLAHGTILLPAIVGVGLLCLGMALGLYEISCWANAHLKPTSAKPASPLPQAAPKSVRVEALPRGGAQEKKLKLAAFGTWSFCTLTAVVDLTLAWSLTGTTRYFFGALGLMTAGAAVFAGFVSLRASARQRWAVKDHAVPLALEDDINVSKPGSTPTSVRAPQPSACPVPKERSWMATALRHLAFLSGVFGAYVILIAVAAGHFPVSVLLFGLGLGCAYAGTVWACRWIDRFQAVGLVLQSKEFSPSVKPGAFLSSLIEDLERLQPCPKILRKHMDEMDWSALNRRFPSQVVVDWQALVHEIRALPSGISAEFLRWSASVVGILNFTAHKASQKDPQALALWLRDREINRHEMLQSEARLQRVLDLAHHFPETHAFISSWVTVAVLSPTSSVLGFACPSDESLDAIATRCEYLRTLREDEQFLRARLQTKAPGSLFIPTDLSSPEILNPQGLSALRLQGAPLEDIDQGVILRSNASCGTSVPSGSIDRRTVVVLR